VLIALDDLILTHPGYWSRRLLGNRKQRKSQSAESVFRCQLRSHLEHAQDKQIGLADVPAASHYTGMKHSIFDPAEGPSTLEFEGYVQCRSSRYSRYLDLANVV
jgi:hypothetical protein